MLHRSPRAPRTSPVPLLATKGSPSVTPVPEKKQLRKPWVRRLLWGLAIAALLIIVGLSLTIFFLYPRMPSFTRKEVISNPVTVSAVDLTDASFSYQAQAVYEFNNPNYAPVKLLYVHFDVYHIPQMDIAGTTTELLIGSVDKQEVTIPMRSIKDIVFDVNLAGDLANARGLIFDCNCKQNVKLHFVGYADISYIGIKERVPQDFEFDTDCSVDVGFPIPCSLPNIPNLPFVSDPGQAL